MENKYAIIDANNKAINFIFWDGVNEYNPGEGLSLILLLKNVRYDFGWTYNNETGQFINPSSYPTEDEYAVAIQKQVDQIAQSQKYADGVSLASYDNSTNPVWAAEAKTFVAWRDQVWAYAFLELEKVKNGQRPQPSIEEFLQELPVISWPQNNTGATGP